MEKVTLNRVKTIRLTPVEERIIIEEAKKEHRTPHSYMRCILISEVMRRKRNKNE